jgi:peptidoglycan/LPS O-acetylase OafA/YrhL
MNCSNPSWNSFFWARFSRLYPLHLITLVVVACQQVACLYLLDSFKIYQFNDVRHFILNVFFIQSWGLDSGQSFNGPTWSVSVEVAVYILYFLMIPLLKRTRLIGALTLLGIVGFTTEILIDVFFYECIGWFMAGVAIWFATSNRSLIKSLFGGVFVTAFSIFSLGKHNFPPVFILLTILLTSALLDRSNLPIHGKWLRRFGELTYSAFLWHVPIQLTIILITEQTSISNSIFETNLFLILYLALVYGVANVSFVYIESPLKRLILSRS